MNNRKRLFPELDSLESPKNTKKAKTNPSEIIPQYIEIANNGLRYHFLDAQSAQQFANNWSKNKNLKVAPLKSHYFVDLTDKQFEETMGPDAFNKLYELFNVFQPSVSQQVAEMNRQLVEKLLNIDDDLLQHAVLICNNWSGYSKWNLLMYAATIKTQDFSKIVERLRPEVVNHVATLQAQDGFCTLASVAGNGTPDCIAHFLERLTAATCNKAATLLDKEIGYNTLMDFVNEPAAFLAYVDRLSNDTLNKAALIRGKNEGTVLDLLIRKLSPENCNKTLSHLIERLTPETCYEICFTNESNFTLRNIAKYPVIFTKILNKMFQSPQSLTKVLAKFPQLNSIQFYDKGRSIDKWSEIASYLLRSIPECKPRKYYADLSTVLLGRKKKRKPKYDNFFSQVEKYGLRLLRLQGRTILFQDENGMILAVKIQKQKESQEELYKEYDTTLYLKKHAQELDLKSVLPDPINVIEIENVLPWLEKQSPDPEQLSKFKEMVGVNSLCTAYLYKVNPKECDYFTYLHDESLPDATFQLANRNIVHDLFTLLKRGVVFTQLADIFHNSEHTRDRDDGGRYMVLVNVLRKMKGGSGRLTAWIISVEFPNLRASGIADLGDRISINDLIRYSDTIHKYFGETQKLHEKKTGNYLIANVMAEYQFVLFLIAGRRACNLTNHAKSENEINEIWQNVAQQIFNNCVQAVSIITHQIEEEVKQFIFTMCSQDRLARQMRYWMTGDYITNLSQNIIPSNLYENNVQIEVAIENFRAGTFNSTKGCSIDGKHADIGPVNGPNPIKEFDRIIYWMVSMILNSYNQFNLSLQDLRKIVKAQDITRAESIRLNSFWHLPMKSYHAIQAALCKQRLTQANALPEDLKQSIQVEGLQHQREYAALIIQNFWRQHKEVLKQNKMEIDPAVPRVVM